MNRETILRAIKAMRAVDQQPGSLMTHIYFQNKDALAELEAAYLLVFVDQQKKEPA